LHTDQGVEFSSKVLRVAGEELGVETELVPARCHESNGLIERLNRTIQEKVRALRIAACFPDAFWSEAALHAVHPSNLTPHSKLKSTTGAVTAPHILYMAEHPDRVQRLHDQLLPFGALCNVTLTNEHWLKLAPRSFSAVVVGTGPSTTHYRVCLLPDSKLEVTIVRRITVSSAQEQEILTRTRRPFGNHRRGNTTFTPTTRLVYTRNGNQVSSKLRNYQNVGESHQLIRRRPNEAVTFSCDFCLGLVC
jgi:hypothetical protein